MELSTVGYEGDDTDLRERFRVARQKQMIVENSLNRAASGELSANLVIDDYGLAGDSVHEIPAPEGYVFEIETNSQELPVIRVDSVSPYMTVSGLKRWLAHNRMMEVTYVVKNESRARVSKSFSDTTNNNQSTTEEYEIHNLAE